MTAPLLRAWRRARAIPTRRRPKHRADQPPRTRLIIPAAVAGVAAATVIGLAYASTDHTTAEPAAVAITDPTTAERIYLDEWADAGITLTTAEGDAAIAIAREHVSHGHLVGMREWIRQDVRDGIPRLDEQQVEVALSLVEHHFLRVTGRLQ